MGETTGSPKGTSGGRSYRRVALALLGLIVVLLVGAFFLDRHLRPHVGVRPLASSAPRKHVSATVQSLGTTVPTTSSPATAAPGTPTVTPAPTATPSPRQQVVEAYGRYWRLYSEALYTLNTSRVGEVAADGELHRINAEVAGFRRQNYAVRVRVTHSALIVSIKGDTATLYDEVRNRSFAIDPVTKKPGQGSNRADLEKNVYTLRRIHGVWKVTRLLRQQGQSS